MKTASCKGFLIASTILLVFGVAAMGSESMPDTYLDYDGGLPVKGEWIGVSAAEVERTLAAIAVASGVTQEEMAMAKGYVADFCACSEERKILETTLTKAAQMNCRGGCFAEAAKCMRDGVESGLSAEKTAAVLVGSMEEVKAECEVKGIDLQEDRFADMLHEKFEDQLAAARMPY